MQGNTHLGQLTIVHATHRHGGNRDGQVALAYGLSKLRTQLLLDNAHARSFRFP